MKTDVMRDKYQIRTILLREERQVELACQAIKNAPRDAQNPIEVIIREQVKTRKQSQNDAMWAGILRDLSEQAWVDGRRFDAQTWHEHCKREFLPEADDPNLAKLVKNPETWVKWSFLPSGEMLCIGSTTKLTTAGMAEYMTQVEAMGASLGVHFTTRGGVYQMMGAE